MTEETRDALYLVDRTSCRRGLPRSQRVPSSEEQQEIDAGVIRRSETGDVINMRAFNQRMAQVGEEDQSVPGWDSTP